MKISTQRKQKRGVRRLNYWYVKFSAVHIVSNLFETVKAEVERIRSARDARKQIQPPKKKVKREIEPIFEPGEVIDLT